MCCSNRPGVAMLRLQWRGPKKAAQDVHLAEPIALLLQILAADDEARRERMTLADPSQHLQA